MICPTCDKAQLTERPHIHGTPPPRTAAHSAECINAMYRGPQVCICGASERARRAQAAAPDALREALLSALSNLERQVAWTKEQTMAALAAPAVPAAIDVERLALAIEHQESHTCDDRFLECAAAIAAAYTADGAAS